MNELQRPSPVRRARNRFVPCDRKLSSCAIPARRRSAAPWSPALVTSYGLTILLAGLAVAGPQDPPPRGNPAPNAPPKAAQPGAPATSLLERAPFDEVYLRGRREPFTVRVRLPRPTQLETIPIGQKVILEKLHSSNENDTSGSTSVAAEQIVRIRWFEDMLIEMGDGYMERRDFQTAFDYYARVVRLTPRWPNIQNKLYRSLMEQANAALAATPPDYDAVITRCLQLREEDRTMVGVQQLLRRACLARAQASIRGENYSAARDQVEILLRAYPGDVEGLKFQRDLQKQAQKLAQDAEKSIEGSVDQQREAVRLLATARRIWPDVPNIERLMARAKRSYPVLQVAVMDLPTAFDPLNARSTSEFQACQLLYDLLVDVDRSGGRFQESYLLERLPSSLDLGMRHRFALKRGLRWSDGEPITAWDVQRSLAMLMDVRTPNYDSERSRFVDEVLVEDPQSLSITLRRPHMQPNSLFLFHVLPRAHTSEIPVRGGAFSRQPIGSGPFQIGPPESPEQVRFISNPEFRAATTGQPYIKELKLQHAVKSSTAVRELEDGKLHMMTQLDPTEVIRFSHLQGQFEVESYLSNSVYMLALNHRRPPLNDRDVRRAMLRAINRPGILTQYFQAGSRGGLQHQLVTGPFPHHSPAYDRKAPPQPFDRGLATQLLAAATKAHKLGGVLTLKYPLGDSAVEKACSQIAKDLRAVGIEIRTDPKIESDLYREVIGQHNFDLVFWRYDHRNVLYNIAPLFDADQVQPGGTNFMGYSDARLASLFNQLRDEQRPLDLWEIQKQIHRFLSDEVAFVPLWQLDNYIAYTSKLVYRSPPSGSGGSGAIQKLPIHPFFLFTKTEGWSLEP